jgi:hypothetical protein
MNADANPLCLEPQRPERRPHSPRRDHYPLVERHLLHLARWRRLALRRHQQRLPVRLDQAQRLAPVSPALPT